MRVRSKELLAIAFVVACLAAGDDASAAGKELSPATESLFLAIRANDIGAVKTSLLAGADVEAENDSGRTPIDTAVDLGNFSIAHYLLAWRKHLSSQHEHKAGIAALPQPPPEPETGPGPRAASEPMPPAENAARQPVNVQTLAPAMPAFEPKTGAPVADGPTMTSGTPAAATASSGPVAPLAEGGKITPPGEVRNEPGALGRIGGLFGDKNANDRPPPVELQKPAQPASQTPTETAAGTSEPGSFLDAIVNFFTVAQTPEKSAPTPASTAPSDKATPPVAAVTPEPAPTEAKQAKVAPGTNKDPIDSFVASVSKILSEAQQQQEAANSPKGTTAPDSRPATVVANAMKEPMPIATATSKAEPPPQGGPASRTPAEATNQEGPGELLGRITDFIFIRSKSTTTTAKPADAPVAVATPTHAKEAPTATKPAAVKTASAEAAKAGVGMNRATVEPAIGTDMRLGKPLPADGRDNCIEGRGVKMRICVEPVEWPRGTADLFMAESGVYRGHQVIVRYDDGVATQYHLLFPTGNFEAVEAYFIKRLGPPGARPDLWVPMIGSANRVNRALRWLGPKPAGGGEGATLEIREFDDLRWSSPPDMTHGVVRLYGAIDETIFKYVSWSDFLLVKMRRDPH